MLLGAHMSVSGGVDRSVERAVETGCRTMQIFTKNANQWSAPPLDPAAVTRFREALAASGVAPVVSHDSYLINLASPDPALLRRSRAAFRDELDRAETLGLMGVVTHPGAHVGRGEEEGLERIGGELKRMLADTAAYGVMILIENTAGQGSSLGWRFEHLAWLIEICEGHPRLGVCLDTCHLHAAGYDMTSDAAFRKTFRDFDSIVGLDRLRVLHMNDSVKPLGSRVDRHTDIGQGTLGPEPFRRVMRSTKFGSIPKILETPKGDDPVAADRANLDTLRRLAAGRSRGSR